MTYEEGWQSTPTRQRYAMSFNVASYHMADDGFRTFTVDLGNRGSADVLLAEGGLSRWPFWYRRQRS